jgi:hypothetical protein
LRRIVIASLFTGTWGGKLTSISGAFSVAHFLKRGSLFGPLIGNV